MRKVIIVLIITILISFLVEECTIAYTIPGNLKETVNFIFIKNEKGKLVPQGTGFFVGVDEKVEKIKEDGKIIGKSTFGYCVGREF